jgi:hypothetical protein
MAHKPGLTRDELEQTRRALEANHGNVRAAAAALGISRRAMQHRMAKLKKFTAPLLPSKSRDIDQLIADKIEESRRAKTADEARDLIHIPVHISGPFGLLVLGDPHVDDAGCDFELLAAHRDIAINHPYVLAASVGDYQNGWIGRLGVLYGEQQVTAREAWKLVEWLVEPLQWLFLVAGNHDLWQGQGDPLEWIAGKQGSLYEPHGVRIELQHPCGAKTRIHARHDFPGTSIYSQLHGPRRELLMGFRDHLVICGHKHTGAQETLVTPDGLVAQIVRVSGYKVADSYAKQLGLKKHPIFPGALVIIDPREPETSPNRIWTAPTVERGVMFLNALRADYEQGTANVSKRKPAAGGSKRVSTGNT